jgi:hypothetical protein
MLIKDRGRLDLVFSLSLSLSLSLSECVWRCLEIKSWRVGERDFFLEKKFLIKQAQTVAALCRSEAFEGFN